MKNLFIKSIIILSVTILNSCDLKKDHNLFNGKNLDNWTIFLKDPGADPKSVFYVEDGILNVSGEPFGYLRSNNVYSDYKLHLEYRWVEKPANSGIFLHVTGEDKIWPLCYECQLWDSKAGDIILMGLGMGMTVKDSIYLVVPAEKLSKVLPKFEETSEKPAGEWNEVEINCFTNNVEIYINGVLQNKGSNLTTSAGSICIQSEGGPMQWRNIRLDPIVNTVDKKE